MVAQKAVAEHDDEFDVLGGSLLQQLGLLSGHTLKYGRADGLHSSNRALLAFRYSSRYHGCRCCSHFS